jgi:tetratricopeptide (TPR) repeat protein
VSATAPPRRLSAVSHLLVATGLLATGCAGASGGRPAALPPDLAGATTSPTAEDPRPAPPQGVDATPAAGVEATSLLGGPLRSPAPSAAFRAEQEALLAAAQKRLAEHPEELDAWIWVGRRTAYLGRHREAIGHYTQALRRFPDSPELLRHRGHRWLTVREIDRAVADLERGTQLMNGRADAVEPDGLPNARNVPTGTLASNLWYHLGLARYLKGEWSGAAAAFAAARDAVDNPDNLVAASYWLYLAHARGGDATAAAAVLAPIAPDLDVIENGDYHRLLLVYAGKAAPGAVLEQAKAEGGVALATVGYGLAAGELIAGRRDAAARLLGRVVAETPWGAFGHLGAEAELARDDELRVLARR